MMVTITTNRICESFAKNKTERMRLDESILLAPCLISFCYFLREAFVWYLSLRTAVFRILYFEMSDLLNRIL